MPSPFRRARNRLAAVAVAAASLFAAGPAAPAPAAERVEQAAAEVRDYWTPARMRAAEPVEVVPEATAPQRSVERRGGAPIVGDIELARPVPDSSAPGVRMHGRVFFSVGDDDFVCSGTAVNSPNRRVVWTAGHCAYDRAGGGYVTNWTFVPAYDDGARPFGEWPAKRLLVTGRYRKTEDLRYDFAAATVARDQAGNGIQDVVGARGIAFNRPRSQPFVAYGYPVVDRFSGNRSQYMCASEEQGGDRFFPTEPRPMAISCDMTGGASGGGWVAPGGVVLSVTSYGYPTDPFTLYGPYQGSAAKKVFSAMSKKRKPRRAGGKGGKKCKRGGKKCGKKGGRK